MALKILEAYSIRYVGYRELLTVSSALYIQSHIFTTSSNFPKKKNTKTYCQPLPGKLISRGLIKKVGTLKQIGPS